MFATDASDLDVLAEALREDGVVVERVMGAGEAQDSHDRLVELVKNVPFPVYVALVKMPEGVAGERSGAANEALATLLHRRIGGAGMYVVGSEAGPQRVVSYGLDASGALLSLSDSANDRLVRAAAEERAGGYVWIPQVIEAEGTVRAAEELLELARRDSSALDYPSTLGEAEVEELADRAVALHARSNWHGNTAFVPVRQVSTGRSTLIGVLAGSAVALFLGQTLRGWPGRRREDQQPGSKSVGEAAPRSGTDSAQEAARARASLEVLAKRLERAASDTRLDQELYARALAAREAAERYVDSDDPVELAGARALVRAGERDLARSRGGRRGIFRPCFFDPRHAEAPGEVGWRLGQGQVRVPSCRRCTKDVTAGREPATLTARRRGRDVPYYTRDDVWARTGFGALTDSFARDVLRYGDVDGDGSGGWR